MYEATRAIGASLVNAVAGEDITPNFHQADVDFRRCEFSVVCNRSFPIVAIVNRPIEMAGLQPIDVPELATALRSFNFEVASAAELQRPIVDSDLEILSKGELDQVKYWKPKRIADLVFNWWD